VMSLKERLMEDMKDAMKKGEQIKLSAIRMVRAGIKNKEIELIRELKDEDVIDVIKTAIKQRKDSFAQFLSGKRIDLAEREKKEIEILSVYLPEQMGEEDIRKRVREVILETGASTSRDMGRVMKLIMPELKGRADGQLINKVVQEMLS
ncbi:MAG: GatB/YqeY domain-containing protein, partial [Nitrospinota bacterium]